jgi:hypothetical protein
MSRAYGLIFMGGLLIAGHRERDARPVDAGQRRKRPLVRGFLRSEYQLDHSQGRCGSRGRLPRHHHLCGGE